MKQTGMRYVDSTWSPIYGCKWKSDGCTNCWAERIAGRYAKKTGKRAAEGKRTKEHQTYYGVAKLNKAGEPKWNGEVEWIGDKFWLPLDWQAKGDRLRIMVCTMSDLFYPKISYTWRDAVFGLISLCGQHTFMVQTKYAEEMRQYFAEPGVWKRIEKSARLSYKEYWEEECPSKGHLKGPLANTWLGVSVENQEMADERIPILLDIPAAMRYVDAQPVLGEMTLDKYLESGELSWVIAGGESGNEGRPCNPKWIRQLKQDCNEHRVAFFMNQWGAYLPVTSDQLKEHAEIAAIANLAIPAVEGEEPKDLYVWPNGEMSVNLNRSDMASMKKAVQEYGVELDGEQWEQIPEF